MVHAHKVLLLVVMARAQALVSIAIVSRVIQILSIDICLYTACLQP